MHLLDFIKLAGVSVLEGKREEPCGFKAFWGEAQTWRWSWGNLCSGSSRSVWPLRVSFSFKLAQTSPKRAAWRMQMTRSSTPLKAMNFNLRKPVYLGLSVRLVLLCSPLPSHPGSSRHWASIVVVLHWHHECTTQTAAVPRVNGSAMFSCCWLCRVGSFTFMKATEEEMLFLELPFAGKKKKNIMEERLVVCCNEASRCGDSTNEAVSCSFSRNVS